MIDRVITILSFFLGALGRLVPVACCAVILSCAFGDEDAVTSLFGGDNEYPLFVAVGGDGMERVILSSLNGRAWSSNLIHTPGTVHLNAAAYGDGRFVVMGPYELNSENYFVSLDGLLWFGGNVKPDARIMDIIYREGLFVAVGMDFVGNESAIWVSMDGLIFARVAAPAVMALSYRGITHGDGTFVAVGDEMITVSTNGLVWSSNLWPSTIMLEDVAYGDGIFVAVGSGGNVMVSQNGMAWSDPFLIDSMCDPIHALSCHLYGIAHDSGIFVAVGDRSDVGGILYSSLEGLVWSGNAPLGMATSFMDVTACRGIFVAVTGWTDYARSGDGITWSSETFSGGAQIQGVTCRP